ncbi:hypothetical protein FB451DRAFT_1263629 [Mycena latifolia]|nr:hypothetical protein FB451DRAFT_1263629 [Mycena latifolia]
MAYEDDLSDLLFNAHICLESLPRDIWDFGELPPADSAHICRDVFEDLGHTKDFSQPQSAREVPEEWTRVILPPVPDPAESWQQRVNLDLWFPLSLISTIISPMASQLHLVPAADLTRRCTPPDYIGPQLPLRNPPLDSDSAVLTAMVNLLLYNYEADSTGAVFCLAPLLFAAYGCELKIRPDVRFPRHLGADVPSLDFALVPEWQPTSRNMICRSRQAPVCFSSPAIVLGIRFEDSGDKSCGLSSQELMQLARATQPHLEALLVARHRCQSESLLAASPACIFGIAFRDMTVYIVAHIPYLHESKYRYRSLVVDELPFPPYVAGDGEGFLARLRIIFALLTIRNHAGRVASLWEGVVWPPTIIDADLMLVRECTGIVTPSPSEYRDPNTLYLPGFFDYDLPSGHGEGDIDPPASEIAHSKELVDGWLPGVQDTDDVLEIEP